MRRMETQSPSLSEQIARLRSAARVQESCAWLPAAVHALIMACLVRLFGRLERMLQLWQSDCLPIREATPQAPLTATITKLRPPVVSARHRSARRSPRRAAHTRARAAGATIPAMPAPNPTAGLAPFGAMPISKRPRSGRDPPPPPSKRPRAGQHQYAFIITISKQ